MAAKATIIHLEHQSRRLGVLWRSQGEEFLEEQAEIINADIDRLRSSYVSGLRARQARTAPIIDLRDDDVAGMACSRDGHGHIEATARCARCTRCRNAFCDSDVVRPEPMHGDPVCTECALALAGVHHKRARPLVAPGRPGRSVRR
jgi:hypothetical protein